MLTLIRTVHTIVWTFFVACILGIFVFAHSERFGYAVLMIAIVMGEVAVLAMNRMRCPLTDIAERHTNHREANFDIYLPLWLARNNKSIFGTLYAAGVVYTLVKWLGLYAT